MSSFFVIGSTGLCGNHFLNLLNASPTVAKVISLSRREPTLEQQKSSAVETILEKDTDKWPTVIKSLELPAGSTMFSGFGTTRKAAGSAENFVKIDHGINLSSFTAAKESGKIDTAIIVSSTGASKDSRFLYMSTKGRLEEDIKALKFRRTIVLRPGILLGQRETSKGWNNSMAEKIGGALKNTFMERFIGTPNYGDEVAKVAYHLSQQPIKKEGEVLVVESAEIAKIYKQYKL